VSREGDVAAPESVDGEWRKSSYSDQGDCVEVSLGVDAVRVRNSTNRSLPSISFGTRQWAEFLAAVRIGEFS
jgi:hypothetical protein